MFPDECEKFLADVGFHRFAERGVEPGNMSFTFPLVGGGRWCFFFLELEFMFVTAGV